MSWVCRKNVAVGPVENPWDDKNGVSFQKVFHTLWKSMWKNSDGWGGEVENSSSDKEKTFHTPLWTSLVKPRKNGDTGC
jgi:hypothetical protein